MKNDETSQRDRVTSGRSHAHLRQRPALLLQEIRAARGGNKHFDSFADRLERELADSTQLEARARRLAELLALALQGSLLVRHAPPEVADAFCASRLAGDAGLVFGTLPADTDFDNHNRTLTTADLM